jgi:dTDP-4-amino-4,6-dideoxygalactose transaminase
MLNTTLAPWPDFSAEEVQAVAGVIASNRVNYWTGQECRNFETEFASWCGSNHAIALSNGTLALDVALRALGVGPGDEVIVTPRTFIASVSSVVLAGAKPVFADVDINSGNISPTTIEPLLSGRTAAIIPVHLAGWPCDMAGIIRLAKQNGIHVIEDCAQAHGAAINGVSVGTFGDVGAWSFCQDKIMTTGGEGGMVTTNNPALWSAMWSFKDHGKDWDAVYNREHAPGFRWVHESFGTNWRMLEVQAAIGRIQLEKMARWTESRAANAKTIVTALAGYPDSVRVPLPEAGFSHAFYRLYAYVKPQGLKAGWSRDRIVSEFAERGVPVMQGSCSEVYLERAFDTGDFRPKERLPNAKELGETSLSFLTHPSLTEADIHRVCDAIHSVMGNATA